MAPWVELEGMLLLPSFSGERNCPVNLDAALSEKRMAQFTILTSRRSGLYSCELDVQPDGGQILPGDMFSCIDQGSPFEFVILAVLPHRSDKQLTLVCLHWLVSDGQLTGIACESRPMKTAERKRYAKLITVG